MAIEGQHQSIQWLSQFCLDVAVAFLETGGYYDVCRCLDGCSKAAKGVAGTYFKAPVFLCDFKLHTSWKIMMLLPFLMSWKTVLLLAFCSCEVT